MSNSKLTADTMALAAAGLILAVVFPMLLDGFWISNIGKYCALAMVAVGIVLAWGYCGILSLGQGIFFGLGGYAMAMFLKLEASGAELPDFMVWSSIEALPVWWLPFRSLTFTSLFVLIAPVVLAFPFSYLIFKKRVSGVYFAIVTIALALTATVLIIGQQGYTGGANGITDFSTLLGMSTVTEEAKLNIYYLQVAILLLVMTTAVILLHTRFGKILIAVRDKEDRVRFSGYNTALIKAFVFTLAGVFSSIGGALFTVQVGLITPTMVGAVASVEMVIYAALGGRLSVTGAVVGALVVGFAKSYLSENFPESWLFFLGTMFILVVAIMPYGLAGTVHNMQSFLSMKNRNKV